MDIIVTVPKREKDNIKAEDDYATLGGEFVQFWAVHKQPKDLKIGDRVYFVVDGAIRYYHVFIGFVYDPVCEVTGRIWRGVNLLLKYPDTKLPTPVPHASFRGFHYTERI